MKRDFKLLRKLLLEVEESSIDGWQLSITSDGELDYNGLTGNEILENMELLKSMKLIKGCVSCNGYGLIQLTTLGHDFLSLTKDPQIWEEILSIVEDQKQSFDFDYLLNLAKSKLPIIKNTDTSH